MGLSKEKYEELKDMRDPQRTVLIPQEKALAEGRRAFRLSDKSIYVREPNGVIRRVGGTGK